MDDDNTTTPAPRQRGGNPERELMRLERERDNLKQSLRAVSKERDQWKEQANTASERFADYDALKTERDTLQSNFDTLRTESSHRLALAEAGVRGKRARRMLLREYKEEHADTAAAERPSVSKWLESIGDDPVLGRLLPQSKAPSGGDDGNKGTGADNGTNAPGAKKTDTDTKPKPKGTVVDPNNGAGGPTPNNTDEVSLTAYSKLKVRGRVQGEALKTQKQKLREAGIIK